MRCDSRRCSRPHAVFACSAQRIPVNFFWEFSGVPSLRWDQKMIVNFWRKPSHRTRTRNIVMVWKAVCGNPEIFTVGTVMALLGASRPPHYCTSICNRSCCTRRTSSVDLMNKTFLDIQGPSCREILHRPTGRAAEYGFWCFIRTNKQPKIHRIPTIRFQLKTLLSNWHRKKSDVSWYERAYVWVFQFLCVYMRV